MPQNLYDLLGVSPDGDAEALRKAFLKAAKESHPDHHGDDPDAAARFRQIAEAYDILRDEEQRAAYDQLLDAERGPLRSQSNNASSDAKRSMVTGAVMGVVLAVALASGYELHSRVSEAAVDEGMTARGPADIAATEPAEQSAIERDRPAVVSAPQMPIALPIEHPVARAEAAPARQTIEVVKDGRGPDLLADRTGAKAGRDAAAKARPNESQHQRGTQSADVQVILAPADRNIVPGPSSSGVTLLPNIPDRGTSEAVGAGPGVVNQPTEPVGANASASIYAAMKQQSTIRASFRHAAPAHRYTRMHAPHCWHRARSS